MNGIGSYSFSDDEIKVTLSRKELELMKSLMEKGLESIKQKMSNYQDLNVPTYMRNTFSSQYSEIENFVRSFARY